MQTLGVLALDTATTPFSVEMILSIEKTARERGWNSFVVNLFADDNAEQTVDLLLAHRPDGVIFTTMGLREVTLPAKLLDKSWCWPTASARHIRSPATFLMTSKGSMTPRAR